MFPSRPDELLAHAVSLAHRPYGFPCVMKLFTFICSLLQPTRNNSDPIRLLGLNLVNTVLETQPPAALSFSGLLSIIQDDLCRHLMLVLLDTPRRVLHWQVMLMAYFATLMQNLHANNLAIFTLTLRIFFHLFVSYRETLKMQFEAFFQCLLNRYEVAALNQSMPGVSSN